MSSNTTQRDIPRPVVLCCLAAMLMAASALADPVFTSEPPTNATVGERYAYEMSAVYIRGDDDDDDDDDDRRRGRGRDNRDRDPDLRFSVRNLPSWLDFDGDRRITGTPRGRHVGIHRVRLRVESRRPREIDEQTFWIRVAPGDKNEAPVIDPIPEQTAMPGTPFELELSGYVSDADNDPLEYRAAGLPPGLGIDTTSGRISGVPEPGSGSGRHNVELTVDDGAARAHAEFVISVRSEGGADIAASASVSPNPALVGGELTWTLTATNVGDVDAGNVTLETIFSGDAAFDVDPPADSSCSLESRESGFAVTCRWSPLRAGESLSAEVTGSAGESGEIVAVSTVSIADASPVDVVADNDEATIAVQVTATRSSVPSQELTAPGAVAVAAGDFDGDSRDDLAVATGPGEPTLIFLRGNDDADDGPFNAVPLSAGEASDAAAVAAADLDADGALDLVVATTDGADHVLFNDGDAGFEALSLDDGADPSHGVVIVDTDGDGLSDIVFAREGTNTVYRNLGSRQFAAAEAIGPGPGTAVAAADLDGDAAEDLVFANPDRDAEIHHRQASGYATGTAIETGPTTSVASRDLDMDGLPDLVFGSADGIAVYLNSPGDLPSFSAADTPGASATVAVLLEDFDGDGRQDIAGIGADGTHRLYISDGVSFSPHPERFVGGAATGAVVGRFDAGAFPDIAVAGGDVVAVFLGDGRGGFGAGLAGAPKLTLNGEPTVRITVGDDYQDAGATAFDDVDGDLTAAIVVDDPVDTSVIGTYTVSYEVVDSSGNKASASRIVEVQARSGSGGGGGGAAGALLLWLALAGAAIARSRSRGASQSSTRAG